jgi:hypothetical protein
MVNATENVRLHTDNHVECGASSPSRSDKRIEEEDHVDRRGGRQLRVVYNNISMVHLCRPDSSDAHSTGCRLTFSRNMPMWYTGDDLRVRRVKRRKALRICRAHGNSCNRASVMPRPARKMGTSPMRGLITDPSKWAIGDCWCKPPL